MIGGNWKVYVFYIMCYHVKCLCLSTISEGHRAQRLNIVYRCICQGTRSQGPNIESLSTKFFGCWVEAEGQVSRLKVAPQVTCRKEIKWLLAKKPLDWRCQSHCWTWRECFWCISWDRCREAINWGPIGWGNIYWYRPLLRNLIINEQRQWSNGLRGKKGQGEIIFK